MAALYQFHGLDYTQICLVFIRLGFRKWDAWVFSSFFFFFAVIVFVSFLFCFCALLICLLLPDN